MTEQEAKDLTVRTWELIVKHELTEKIQIREIDEELYPQIKAQTNSCPLCTLFNTYLTNPGVEWDYACKGCPLYESGNQCDQAGDKDPYSKWAGHYTDLTEKMEGARRILKIVQAWEPDGGNDEAEAHR